MVPDRFSKEPPERLPAVVSEDWMPQRLDFVQRANAAYIEDMHARFLRDATSVPEEWALFFAGFEFAGERPAASA